MSTIYEIALTSLAACADTVRALNHLGLSTAKNAINSIVEEKLSEITEELSIEFMSERTFTDFRLSAGWDADNLLSKAIPLEKRNSYVLVYEPEDYPRSTDSHGPWLPPGVTLVRRPPRDRL